MHLCVAVQKIAPEVGRRYADANGMGYFISSCHFSQFLDTFLGLMERARENVEKTTKHYELILTRTQEINDHTQKLLRTKDSWVADIEKQKNTVDELLVQVGKKTSEFEQQREQVKVLDREASEIAGMVQSKEHDLSTIRKRFEPPLLLAKDTLRTLNKDSLAGMKAFNSPPEAIEKVFGCILYLTSKPGNLAPDISWAKSRRTMASVDRFMIELQQLDAEKVPAENTEVIMPFLADPQLQPEPLDK
eukprot:1579943-Rhodomonas_salina.1